MSATYLLDPAHRPTLEDWARGNTLFVFDYDSALAPRNGDRPANGNMSPEMRRHLEALAQNAAVAVISGRTRQELLQRLPHGVQWVMGNHGIDGLPQGMNNADEQRRLCSAWEAHLMSDATLWHDAPGAVIENRGRSLTLRYREAQNPVLARSRLLARAVRLTPAPRIVRGQEAIDLLPPRSFSKAEAINMLMQASDCDHVMVVGEDTTGEPVFQAAPENWLTVQVGTSVHTDARCMLKESDEVGTLLMQLCAMRQSQFGYHSPAYATGHAQHAAS